MRRILAIATVTLFCVVGATTIASAQPANVDQTTSDGITKYLHTHKLPMVGAQVSNSSSGRQLMLYGFVATDFGKQDAETKSKRFLHDSSIAVVNNIRVNPQIRHLKKRSAPSNEGGADEAGNPNPMPRADWENTFDSTLRAGGATPSNDPALKMPPPGPSTPPPNFP